MLLRSLACLGLLLATVSGARAQTLPNDDCPGALALAVGPNGPFSNAGATTSAPPWCFGAGRDLWYRIDVPAGQLMRMRVCSTSTDAAAVELFTGDCANLRSLVCALDGCAPSNLLFGSGGAAGTRYFLRVGGFPSQPARYTIDVDLVTPAPNDECAGALPLLPGRNGPFSNQSSGPSSPRLCLAGAVSDVWFQYLPAISGIVTLEVCGVGTFGPVVELLDGACGNHVSRLCERPLCGRNQPFRVQTVAGRPLLVRVGGMGASIGSFTIDLREFPAPPNDDCANALPLLPGANGPFDISGAWLSEPWFPSGGAEGSDLWFSWLASMDGELLLDLSSPLTRNLHVQSYDGTCAQRTTRTFGSASFDPARPVRIPIRRGQNVLLRAGYSEFVPTSISLSAREVPSPAFDECAQALPLVEGANGPFVDAGATPSGPFACGTEGRDLWFRYSPRLAQGDTTIDLCQPSVIFSATAEFYTGTCGNLALQQCVTTSNCLLSSAFVQPTSSATPILIRVHLPNQVPLAPLTVQVTERPAIRSRPVATACGGGSLQLNGTLAPGQLVGFRYDYPAGASAALLLFGLELPTPLPLCPGTTCALGVDAWSSFASRSLSFRVPYTPWMQGASFAAQGIAFGTGSIGCPSGSGVVQLTDTIAVVFQ